MGNAGINTTLTVTGFLQNRTAQVINLLQTYFPGTKVYDGHRPLGEKFAQIGQGQISFPCLMVECTDSQAVMITTAKWDRQANFSIFAYMVDNNPESLANTQRGYVDALVELFSNNALGDFGGGSPTYKYRVNGGYWYDSKIKGITLSPIFKWGEANAQFMRALIFRLMVVDRLLE
jgi:hypothetical protein